MQRNRQALIIQPVVPHWNSTFAIVARALAADWDVTVCASEGVLNPIRSRLKSNMENVIFQELAYDYKSFLKCVMRRWDIVVLSYRPLETKSTDTSIREYIKDLSNKITFLAIVIFASPKTQIIFDCHQIRTIQLPAVKSRQYSLRLIEQFGKWYINRVINRYFVYDFPIKTALVRHFESLGKFKACNSVVAVPAIVGLAPKGRLDSLDNEILRIVIPGRIDLRRRDYAWLDLVPEKYRRKICVGLAGRLRTEKDRTVLHEIERLHYEKDVRLNGDYIDQSLFDKVCSEADLLLAPLIAKFGDRTIGYDTTTGALWDAFYYRKPLLLPLDIPIGPIYEPGLLRYSSREELVERICTLVSDRGELQRIRESFDRNLQQIGKESEAFCQTIFGKI